MPQGGIDRRAIAKFMRDMQREFDKHPIRIPMEADAPAVSGRGYSAGPTIYNGPVIHGDANGAQLAWGNQDVTQGAVNRTEQIAPGFEAIAQAVALTLQQLPAAGLEQQDELDAKAVADEVLAEVIQPEPDRGKIRRAVSTLKGFLAPVAVGIHTGTAEGAQEWAKTAIEQLGTPF